MPWCGLLRVVPESRGSRRLDGGVRSQIRTGLPVICQKEGDFPKKQREDRSKYEKAANSKHFSSFQLNRMARFSARRRNHTTSDAMNHRLHLRQITLSAKQTLDRPRCYAPTPILRNKSSKLQRCNRFTPRNDETMAALTFLTEHRATFQ
jgi:hypothetical protein